MTKLKNLVLRFLEESEKGNECELQSFINNNWLSSMILFNMISSSNETVIYRLQIPLFKTEDDHQVYLFVYEDGREEVSDKTFMVGNINLIEDLYSDFNKGFNKNMKYFYSKNNAIAYIEERDKSKSKHIPFDYPNPDLKGKWVKYKESDRQYMIVCFDPTCVDGNFYYLQEYWTSNQELFKHYTFEDGSIIGQEVTND